MTSRFTINRLTLAGFACGTAFAIGRVVLEGGAAPLNPAFVLGLATGGGLGGALLVAVVATLRDAVSKSGVSS